ncbi:TonB-dependent receptor [Brevundimonas variabilis]|uniref:Outer membrane receptor protein involved in Fe transport n=1 Tax=Brevundimonas variabilis TaxID=74312 RepID=A0A7W9CIU7_9CAUL|nr:TonB-dependent receptor [Brevundimonas variabilis]MBB5746269.1 outer membrane receptor protein involved in Fe transport [Brevundimonas variabilis]
MTTRIRTLGTASALAVAASMMLAGGAMAQGSTSTLRGAITDAGAAESGGTITVTDTATGYVTRSRIGTNGAYTFSGLRPGTYRVDVTTADGQTATDTVTITLGGVATLNLDVASPAAPTAPADASAADLGEIVVTGRRIFEVRTSEVATNVSRQQINDLPQINRNFLNFAALAPGVVVQEGDTERTISAGGQPSIAVNVFIDGQSQKSTILDGGIAGQDDSRGNPFPQAAVQEFRVISQNFKAEYEQAGSSIITSVTRSGTNDFGGDMFVQYQPSDWVAQDIFSQRRGAAPAKLDRLQYGGSVGGPIIEDKLHYFLTYERKDETRERQVFLNRTEYAAQFANQLGTFEAPFEQDLFFGKLSWQVDDRQRIDLSATYRTEADIRDFGNGATAFSRANQINQETTGIVLKHQFQGDSFVNEFSIDYLDSLYNPVALNFTDVGQTFVIYRDNVAATPAFDFNYNNTEATVFNQGGGTNNQNIQQQSLTFKNDLTFNAIEFGGTHTIKVGVKYSMQDYYVQKDFNRNPQFTYDITANPAIFGSATIPTRVTLNLPVEPTDAQNNVFGIYIQDDWQVTDKLELNLGLRWDYEDNAVNSDYTTPQTVREVVTRIAGAPGHVPWVNINDYLTDGGREPFKDAWQPRVGFSYDIFGDERTVLFGGAGRYYDRIGFNFAFDERYKPFQLSRTIFFSPNGGTFGGQTNTVAWNETYRTAAGLDALLGGTQGRGEIFLVKNEAPSPFTDQFNLGVRQKIGDIQTSLTFSYAKTQNEFQWSRLNVNQLNQVINRPSSFTNAATNQPYAFNDSVFYSDHERERTYMAMFFQIDRPYTAESGYGYQLTYTLADGEQNGSRDQGLGNFDFDYPNVGLSPTFNSPGVERHRIVASGTLDLPFDFRLSSIITLGSGRPFTGFPGINGTPIEWNAYYPEKKAFLPGLNFAYRQVDLRLTRPIELWNGNSVEFTLDAINVFNFRNYSGFNQTLNLDGNNAALRRPNPLFGAPTAQFVPTQSFQVGMRYVF